MCLRNVLKPLLSREIRGDRQVAVTVTVFDTSWT